MPREKTPIQATFDLMLREFISPLFKEAGFKKNGANYFFCNESIARKVDFQSSMGSSGFVKKYYINVQVGFSELYSHFGEEREEKIKLVDVHKTGIRDRIEFFYPHLPDRFELSMDDNYREKGEQLKCVIESLLIDLLKIVDLDSYTSHQWFVDKQGSNGVKVLACYLLGDKKRYREELSKLVSMFEGRKGLCDESHWTKELNVGEKNV